MTQPKFQGKRTLDEIDPMNPRELSFTDEDWEDLNRGIELFNAGKFWHAHETWEQVWRRHHEDSRLFIQGLIQMAAAFHLSIDKKRYTGALSNFDKALSKLQLFGQTFLDLPVSHYTKAIEKAKDEIQRVQKGEVETIDRAVVPLIAFLKTH
jgi:tetratricopeptide (TPR) repeat protein